MQVITESSLLPKHTLQDAQDAISKCVHCGFCLATCPTYRILGEESNSPRGRIYSIKTLLEGGEIDTTSLDKCVSCRSCETTCPSGVEYHTILGIGKTLIYKKRSIFSKIFRASLVRFLTTPLLFNAGAWVIAKRKQLTKTHFSSSTKGKVLLHGGCVQQPLLPDINTASKHVLMRLGYEVSRTKQSQCCGAIAEHLDSEALAHKQIKANIDAWYEEIKAGVQAIISNASGCGLMIKDYPEVLKHDNAYYEKAKVVSEHTKDITEFLGDEDLSAFPKQNITISYHEPCTLQHGQKLAGTTRAILLSLGYELPPLVDNHLCCGSAGTYSLFEPKIATTLRDNKLSNLGTPDVIVSSNVGCIMHLQKGTKTPVKHWIELLT